MTMSRTPLVALDCDQLTTLVFELASHLHVERTHRLALELALERAGILGRETIAEVGQLAQLRDASIAAADHSLGKLLQAVAEASVAEPELGRSKLHIEE